ncbi:MAG: metallophosphoesterase, partial [Candidatus Hodarchaeales archaeon]
MRILTLADIHGNAKALRKLVSYLIDHEKKIDLIIIAGDMPITTPVRFMLKFILTHVSLSKEKYTKWVYRGKGRKLFVELQKESIIRILNALKRLEAPII